MLRRYAQIPLLLIALMLVILASMGSSDARAQAEAFIEVSGIGRFDSLEEAIEASSDGDVVTVSGGFHSGHFVIDRSITLKGENWPVLDAGGFGNVVTVRAPDVTISGFVIRNSGIQLVEENAAIEVDEAPRAFITGNRIEESLFGVYLKLAPNSTVSENRITGKDLDVARRGDAIRVWSSHDTVIENNIVSHSRDVVLWYSERLIVRGNEITDGRYGLHFMYDDDALVEDNRLTGNSVGAFLMYSRRLNLRHNVIGDNRGPSGYGIGMKDLDDAVITENLFADNRVGAYIDNSPREIDGFVKFDGNVFTLNDFGLRLMPSVKRNEYSGNTFADNQEQVEAGGGGSLVDNMWSVEGRGNYWSDYSGYDSDGDGYGDVPYTPQRLFEKLVDQHPELRLLTYSPAAQAIDFAAEVIPFVRPEPKLTDDSPLMSPTRLPGLELDRSASPFPVALASLGMIAGGAGVIGFAFMRRGATGSAPAGGRKEQPPFSPEPDARPIISVSNLSKKFGAGRAVDDVSFDIAPGKGVALWGPNGAGKTTILRCMLGIYSFGGQITVCGHDIAKSGKNARRMIGLVPQEIAFHDDLSVRETIHLYARLRKEKSEVCDRLLAQLQLIRHQRKQVRQLSGGLKQRLALAVALLGDPPVLFLDEPTANLDAGARTDFMALLEQLKSEGKTLVFASHRPSEVKRLADSVVSLEDGKLIAYAPPAELPQFSSGTARLRIEVGATDVARALEHLNLEGFQASRNGTGVYVDVDPSKKAEPMSALVRAGLPVSDFDLERSGFANGMEDSDD